MRWPRNPIRKIAFVLPLVAIASMVLRCFPTYQGDGLLLQERTFSFRPVYEIYFPPFDLKPGKISQTYRFQGVSRGKLSLRLYPISESGKRIRITLMQKVPEFIDELAIAIRLLENKKEVLNVENAGKTSGGSGELYYLSDRNDYLSFLFSGNATYELQTTVYVKENPPVPVKIQFSLGHSHGCSAIPCETILWNDLLKKSSESK